MTHENEMKELIGALEYWLPKEQPLPICSGVDPIVIAHNAKWVSARLLLNCIKENNHGAV